MDRVTGKEVEFHLRVLHARQDGQAIVWVAVTMLLVVALFVAGVGIAQLMLFHWDAQGAADAAALAGANIQAQALMSIAFLETIIYARNAVVSVLYFTAAALGVICVGCLIAIGCWACPLAPQVLNAAIQFENATEPAVTLIQAVQTFIRWVFPFYASANATWYGWKNGALAIGLPFPLPLQWPEDGDGTSDSGPEMGELSQQLSEISNCLDLLKYSEEEGVFYIPDDIRNTLEGLDAALDRDDIPAMPAALRDLQGSDLWSRMARIIEAIDRMEAGANQCNLAKVDGILAGGLQCSATVSCEGKTEIRCTQHGTSGRNGFIETLEHLRQDAREIQEWLDRIDDCLADKKNEGCTRQIADGLLEVRSKSS